MYNFAKLVYDWVLTNLKDVPMKRKSDKPATKGDLKKMKKEDMREDKDRMDKMKKDKKPKKR